MIFWKGEVLPNRNVRVRSDRSLSNNILYILPKGARCEVYEDDGTWIRINATKQEWVRKCFFIPVKEGDYIPSDSSVDNIVLDIKPLFQGDCEKKLGTSDKSAAVYGCLLTDITMYVNYLLDTNYNQSQLSDIIRSVDGWVHYDKDSQSYLSGGDQLRLSSIWKAFPNQITADKLIRTPLTYAPLNEIDEVLADKRPVIAEMRMSNHGQEHWVLIVGKLDGRYVCNDPQSGKSVCFNDVFGDPGRWIYTIASYAVNGRQKCSKLQIVV